MNTLSLSVSKPSSGNGISLRTSPRTSVSSSARAPATARIRSSPWRCRSASASAQSCPSPSVRYAPPDPPRQSRAADHPNRRRCAPERCAGSQPRRPRDGASVPRWRSDFPQRPIDRGGTHRQQARPHLRRELKWPCRSIASTRIGNQRTQPLAANPVRCFPDHHQGFAHRGIIDPPLRPRARSSRRRGPARSRRIACLR